MILKKLLKHTLSANMGVHQYPVLGTQGCIVRSFLERNEALGSTVKHFVTEP